LTQRGAYFAEATFTGNAGFSQATFSSHAFFGGVTFASPVVFQRATFDSAGFGGVSFTGDVTFSEATSTGPLEFAAATFAGGVTFDKGGRHARRLVRRPNEGGQHPSRNTLRMAIRLETPARRVGCRHRPPRTGHSHTACRTFGQHC